MDENRLSCAADSRVSNNGSQQISNTGAKLFTIPVRTHKQKNDQHSLIDTHTLGFAFAGSTLLATNTHAIASNCTQMLLSAKDSGGASMDLVANIYQKAAEYVTKDMNQNFAPPQWQFFDFLIFGYCKTVNDFQAYFCTKKIENNVFEMAKEKIPFKSGLLLSFGSGKEEFNEKLEIKNSLGLNRPVFTVFQDTINNSENNTIGGNIQLMESTKSGTVYVPVVTQDEDNPDVATLLVNGFNTSVLKNDEGISIGLKAIDIGLNKITARAALKEYGLDPESSVSREIQNLASIAFLFKKAVDLKTPIAIEEIYTIEKITPIDGNWYFYRRCKNCKRRAPFFEDFHKGSVNYQITGLGSIQTKCIYCNETVKIHSKLFRSAKWKDNVGITS